MSKPAGFPVTIRDSYYDEVTFNVTADGAVIIAAPRGPIVLEEAAGEEFAQVLVAATHEAGRRGRDYARHLEEMRASGG
jgi:hypothetical protein